MHLSVTLRVETHSDMRLIGQFEFLLFNHIVNILIFSNRVLGTGIFACFSSFWIDLLGQARVIGKEFGSVNERDRVDWNIGCLMFKTAMHVDARIDGPNGRSEALNGTEFVPLGGLSVVDFKCDIFTNLISTSAYHHHDRSEEDRRMLVTRCGCLARLVWSFHPVPSTITMAT